MVEEIVEITKEEYDKLVGMDPKQAFNYIAENYAVKSGYHPAGYGFYSPSFYINGIKYFVKWLRGRSCD